MKDSKTNELIGSEIPITGKARGLIELKWNWAGHVARHNEH